VKIAYILIVLDKYVVTINHNWEIDIRLWRGHFKVKVTIHERKRGRCHLNCYS